MPETIPQAVITIGDRTHAVRPLAKRIWECLMAVPGAVVPYTVISDALWPDGTLDRIPTIRQQVNALRNQMGDDVSIQTFHGKGSARVDRVGREQFPMIAPPAPDGVDQRIDQLRSQLQAAFRGAVDVGAYAGGFES